MNVTFILAKNYDVTPFEIMAQDLEEVIMVVNYLLDSGSESKTDNCTSDKENDKDFWNGL